MMLEPGAKTSGDHWDSNLNLYLDVPAQNQAYPLWWDEEPTRYQDLQTARQKAGIKIEDDLFHFPTGGRNFKEVRRARKQD
jgi:hypothetical protein